MPTFRMSAVIDLAPWAWILLAVAGTVVGLSKTALPGANTVAVAIFAALLPAWRAACVPPARAVRFE